MSNLPKAVARQVQQAKREYAEAYADADQPQGTDAAAPPAGNTQTTPPPVAQPLQEAVAQPSAPSQTSPTPPVGSAPPAVPPAATPSSSAADKGDSEETWEQRYRSLKGMFDSKMRELQHTNRELNERLAGMERTIAAVATPKPEAPSNERRLRNEDVEAYGEDMIDVIRKAAYDEVQPLLQKIQSENAELKSRLGQVAQRTAYSDSERMLAHLTSAVPNWEAINQDPNFLQWLEERDVFSGQRRQDLLDKAGTEMDAHRVAAFFTAYLDENQAIQGRTQGTDAAFQPPAQETSRQPQVDMASLVAPGRPAAAGARAAAGEEDIQPVTQAQISAFYRDVQRGLYRNDPQEKTRVEKLIHRAVAAGRVRA